MRLVVTDIAVMRMLSGCGSSSSSGSDAGLGQQDFATGCAAYPNLSIVLRDQDLVTPQNTGYVYDGC